MKYDIGRPWESLDPWQEAVIKTKGNIVLRSGRQVGKSAVIGVYAGSFALENPKKSIMIIAKTERQAQLLFMKVLNYVHFRAKTMIKTGKDRPTKHQLNLKNGTTIHCLPAGDTGYGIMGYTIDLLIADEAAFIPEEVWNSVIPTLTITKGNIILLSTPFLKEGYYYNCFKDPSFKAFHQSSEDCPRRDDEFLARQKNILTKAQYAQMYLGNFVDDLKRFFPEELIQKCCVLERRKVHHAQGKYYLGVDVARFDKDEFTMQILDKVGKDSYEQVENICTTEIPIPENVRAIVALNRIYNFKAEYIDSGGMGIAVCDLLREDPKNKRKVVEINNSSRSINQDDKQKRILKDDLYENLKTLMEQGRIKFLDDETVKDSLRSILREQDPITKKTKIWGTYSHIVEGLIRAAWCSKDKTLNIYAFYK